MNVLADWWRRPPVRDAAVAATLCVAVIFTSMRAGEGQAGVEPVDLWACLLIGAASAGLLFRRTRPWLCLLVTLGATLAFLGLHYPYGPIFLYVAVGLYSAAVWRGARYGVLAGIAVVLAHVPWAVYGEDDPEGPLWTLGAMAAWLAAPVGVGIAVRTARESQRRAVAEDRLRQVYEERLRIAQEIHDVVGHSLAVISVNAGAALHVLSKYERSPEIERSLRAIRLASNGALDELRATLATFTGAVAVPDKRPAPGLHMVAELVGATDVDGLAVALDVRGQRGDVPTAVDLAGYRIVQEALTNVVRHAGARRAEVTVDYRPSAVTLTVVDDGRGLAAPGAGTGLDSMRERAAALRGTFSAGPGPDGGFRVTATLPLKATR